MSGRNNSRCCRDTRKVRTSQSQGEFKTSRASITALLTPGLSSAESPVNGFPIARNDGTVKHNLNMV